MHYPSHHEAHRYKSCVILKGLDGRIPHNLESHMEGIQYLRPALLLKKMHSSLTCSTADASHTYLWTAACFLLPDEMKQLFWSWRDTCLRQMKDWQTARPPQSTWSHSSLNYFSFFYSKVNVAFHYHFLFCFCKSSILRWTSSLYFSSIHFIIILFLINSFYFNSLYFSSIH